MGQTLEQRMNAIHHIVYDHQTEPYPRVSCWCGASLEIDWEQGVMEVARRLTTFIAAHKACPAPEVQG